MVLKTREALSGPGDTGEHGEASLGKFDADVGEIVLPRALYSNQIVTVGGVRCRFLRDLGRRHARGVS